MKRSAGRPRGGRKGRIDPERARLARKVDELVAQSGIPRPWAWQVARGQATLQDALTRLARHDRIEQLARRHGLDRSLAAQVADGHIELSDALHGLRRRAHLLRNEERSILREALDDGRARTLHLHGLSTRTGRITAVDRYEFDLTDDAGADRIHKLQLKFGYLAGAGVEVGASPAGPHPAEPVVRPQDRFHMSGRRIFRHIDDGDRLVITTLEGERLVGVPVWVSRWEIGLQQGADELVVLRHAIAAAEVS